MDDSVFVRWPQTQKTGNKASLKGSTRKKGDRGPSDRPCSVWAGHPQI